LVASDLGLAGAPCAHLAVIHAGSNCVMRADRAAATPIAGPLGCHPGLALYLGLWAIVLRARRSSSTPRAPT
jgi:hypothetical protein